MSTTVIRLRHDPALARPGTWREPSPDEWEVRHDALAVIRCAACGTQDVIDRRAHKADRHGNVLPEWRCRRADCDRAGYLVLDPRPARRRRRRA